MLADTTTDRVEAATQLSDNVIAGERYYLPWSCSRMETACTCLFKFYNIYYNNNRETSQPLVLGSISHAIIATLLRNKITDLATAGAVMAGELDKANPQPNDEIIQEVRKMLPYMISFVASWNDLLTRKGIKKDRIEQPYGLTKEATRSTFYDTTGDNCYFRGIVDLWTYDSKEKVLYIVDHKTNAKALSKHQVKNYTQLRLYVAMLALIFHLDFKKAYIALNFLRKGKCTWAVITPNEAADFMASFYKLLEELEYRIFAAENSMVWEPTPSFRCSYCSFKDICPGRGDDCAN